MKYVALFATSLMFIVIGHFRTQRKKQAEIENISAALREEQRRSRAAEQRVVSTGSGITLLPTVIRLRGEK